MKCCSIPDNVRNLIKCSKWELGKKPTHATILECNQSLRQKDYPRWPIFFSTNQSKLKNSICKTLYDIYSIWHIEFFNYRVSSVWTGEVHGGGKVALVSDCHFANIIKHWQSARLKWANSWLDLAAYFYSTSEFYMNFYFESRQQNITMLCNTVMPQCCTVIPQFNNLNTPRQANAILDKAISLLVFAVFAPSVSRTVNKRTGDWNICPWQSLRR